MNPIVLFFIQVLAWLGLASVISNPYLTPWIAYPLMGTPILISYLAWRVPSANWNWPFARVRNDSGKLLFRRRIGFAVAIVFVFFHLAASHLIRRANEDGSIIVAQIRIQADASHLSEELLAFPSSHSGTYPKFLTDLRDAGDSSATNTTRCQYFVSEMKRENLGPDAIMFARRFIVADELPGLYADAVDPSHAGNRWLLYTMDGQSVWISDRQFNDPVYQTAILGHKPIPLPISSFDPR